MTQSFTAKGSLSKAQNETKRRVLVTGAAGNIGSYFAEHSHQKYHLRLMVQAMDEDAEKIQDYGEVVVGDLTDLDKMKELCAEMDTVVHLAADPDPGATWDSLLGANIIGTYNTYIAAKAAGCRRLIYASSIHAVSGYPADIQVKTNDPVNPGDLYGVTKCFGEAMGRYMAEQENLSVVAIRIGAFQARENIQKDEGIAMLDAWVSRRDLNQLIEKCIDAEDIQFAVLNGISNNRFKRLDISDARALVGYEPQDDATEENWRLKELHLNEKVSAHSQSDPQKDSGIRKDV